MEREARIGAEAREGKEEGRRVRGEGSNGRLVYEALRRDAK
jgi:hypothetical protein